MFEALFGTEMPLALRFFIAFVIVLALIGAAAYLVRRFGATALNAAVAARGRQPRLAVSDAATHRRAPPSRPHPPRQCRASGHDRRPDRRGDRTQHRARDRNRARP